MKNLPDRITARALGHALDPKFDVVRAADELAGLSGGNSLALRRALNRVRASLVSQPSRVAQRAADALIYALGELEPSAA